MSSLQQLLYTSAIERGDEALAQAEMALQNALREVRSYRAKYQAATEPREKADQLNWALHYCAGSVMSNMRFDLLANAQAGILVTSGYKP